MISDAPESVNGFSEELQQQLDEHIQFIKDQYQPPHIAAFDADGTLWATDVGQLLYNYQLENDLLKISSNEAREIEANLASEETHDKLYIWQAEINAGFSVEQITEWVKRSQAEAFPQTVFEPIKELIQKLTAAKFDVYVVSASFDATLMPATDYLNVPSSNLIGAALETSKGQFVAPMKKTMTSRQGKVERLLDQTCGQLPHICVGNTMGDFELLNSALIARLAVSSAPEGHRVFESEQKLRKAATEHGWLNHRF